MTWDPAYPYDNDPAEGLTGGMVGQTITPRTVPGGVHPGDNSVPYDDQTGYLGELGPLSADNVPSHDRTKRKPWAVENDIALPVYQRASDTWTGNSFTISGTLQLIGRQKGRSHVTLWVPATASQGVLIAPTEGEVDNLNGVSLAPGDSLTLPTEAPIYVGLLPSQVAGTINYVAFLNPPGTTRSGGGAPGGGGGSF